MSLWVMNFVDSEFILTPSCQFNVNDFERFRTKVANGCNIERTRWGCTSRILKGWIFLKRSTLTFCQQYRIHRKHLRLDWSFLYDTILHILFRSDFLRAKSSVYFLSVWKEYSIANPFQNDQQLASIILNDCWVKRLASSSGARHCWGQPQEKGGVSYDMNGFRLWRPTPKTEGETESTEAIIFEVWKISEEYSEP